MTRKRSPYRPKGVNPRSIFVALGGVCLLSKDDQATRAMALRLAVQDVAKGVVAKQGWKTIVGALNTLEAFSKYTRVISGAEEFIGHAQDAIMAIIDRRKAEGYSSLRAHELQALLDLESLWAQVLAVVTHQEFFQAEQQVARYVSRVLRHGGGRTISLGAA